MFVVLFNVVGKTYKSIKTQNAWTKMESMCETVIKQFHYSSSKCIDKGHSKSKERLDLLRSHSVTAVFFHFYSQNKTNILRNF